MPIAKMHLDRMLSVTLQKLLGKHCHVTSDGDVQRLWTRHWRGLWSCAQHSLTPTSWQHGLATTARMAISPFSTLASVGCASSTTFCTCLIAAAASFVGELLQFMLELNTARVWCFSAEDVMHDIVHVSSARISMT